MAFKLALPKLIQSGKKNAPAPVKAGTAPAPGEAGPTRSRLKLYGMAAVVFFVLTAIAA